MSRDRAAALVLLLFALGGALEAARLTIGAPDRPGPGFLPFGLALALGAVALGLLLQPVRAAPRPPTAERVRWGKAVLALVASVAYAFALAPIGFVLTTVLFLLLLLKVIEGRGWWSSLAIALATTIASHVVFKTGLAVRLPAGPWGF